MTDTAVHNIMKSIKSKVKSASVWQNLAELKPAMNNETRWSGKVAMLHRFNEMYDEILEASAHDDEDFAVNQSVTLVQQTEKYYNMLAEVDMVAKSLQRKVVQSRNVTLNWVH